MKRILAILIVATSILAGCTDSKKTILIKGYEMQEITGVEFSKNSLGAGLMLNLDIENQTRRTVLLESGQATLYNSRGNKFGKISITEPVLLPKEASGKIGIPLKATFLNPMAILSSGFLKSGDFDPAGITADIDITVRSGAFSKNISKKGLPLDQLADLLSETTNNRHEDN